MCSACQFTFKSCVGSHRFLIFLKGSKKMTSTLKETKPNDYSYFEKIWDLRNRHMVTGLPEQYVFFFYLPCYETDCVHPVCQRGRPDVEMTWFEGGPSLPEIPFSIPDPAWPWGGECDKCTSGCYGHFLPPKECVEHTRQHGMKDCMLTPPSAIIKEAFEKSQKSKTPISSLEDGDNRIGKADTSSWAWCLVLVTASRKHQRTTSKGC